MILIVNRSKRYANTFTEIFHYMGILSHTATPTEALSEISTLYRAVLVVDPETLPSPEDFVKKLSSYADIPIFAISDTGEKNPYASLFSGSYKHAITSAHLAYNIAKKSNEMGKPMIGDYRLAGFNATCDLDSVLFFDKPIEFTKTEKMIFRYLIRCYPLPQKPQSILKYAFRPSRHPSAESIKTHVSLINKKFLAIKGLKLICTFGNSGYVVNTPEIMLKIERNENIFT